MANITPKIGFRYFSSQEYLLDRHVQTWFQSMQKWGASAVIIPAKFDLVIPEDIFESAKNYGLEPIIHFNNTLPSARVFNDCIFFLDMYKKWGVKYVILGDKPNNKSSWPMAQWHDETLADRFLERFIPLADYAVRIGLQPIMAPLQPGGDYWDCAFLELILSGLKQRKMAHILDTLILASFGYTFSKPLSWGAGGPERWPASKPYITPAGQEDQLGFHHFEWMQAVSQQVTGEKMPVIILDAGTPGASLDQLPDMRFADTLQKILTACQNPQSSHEAQASALPRFNDLVFACCFNLKDMKRLLGTEFSPEGLERIFRSDASKRKQTHSNNRKQKYLDHYLLLPAYDSGVSDVVLNKVRPLIKKFHPTVGFSIDEASCASRVSIYPDPFLFTDAQIDQLRAAGCKVEILPQSGIEIATLLQS